jgi:hypothetical protein
MYKLTRAINVVTVAAALKMWNEGDMVVYCQARMPHQM